MIDKLGELSVLLSREVQHPFFKSHSLEYLRNLRVSSIGVLIKFGIYVGVLNGRRNYRAIDYRTDLLEN
jgi:hypothetical protein